MKGYITLEFDGKPSHYIKVEHITMITDKNGYANLTLINGEEIETNKKTIDIIKAIKEQI
jgi:hypothetical protein